MASHAAPAYCSEQVHVPTAPSQVPCPEQLFRHGFAATEMLHAAPSNSSEQAQVPENVLQVPALAPLHTPAPVAGQPSFENSHAGPYEPLKHEQIPLCTKVPSFARPR